MVSELCMGLDHPIRDRFTQHWFGDIHSLLFLSVHLWAARASTYWQLTVLLSVMPALCSLLDFTLASPKPRSLKSFARTQLQT